MTPGIRNPKISYDAGLKRLRYYGIKLCRVAVGMPPVCRGHHVQPQWLQQVECDRFRGGVGVSTAFRKILWSSSAVALFSAYLILQPVVFPFFQQYAIFPASQRSESRCSMGFLRKNNVHTLRQPPYSTDLYLIGHVCWAGMFVCAALSCTSGSVGEHSYGQKETLQSVN